MIAHFRNIFGLPPPHHVYQNHDHFWEKMRNPNLSTFTIASASILLTACGGGGGSGTGAAVTVYAPVKMSELSAPATWPINFKSPVSVSLTSLATSAELAQTSNATKAIFIQIWYLDQEQKRQTLAFLSLEALTRMGGSITIANVPLSITTLKTEVYTANGKDQLTLASKDIGI